MLLSNNIRYLLLIFLLFVSVSCSSKQSNSHKYVSNKENQKQSVFVSILPMKYFVERIGGRHFDVQVLVGTGQSPATDEPTPRQMAKLNDAIVYFRIGVPFENVWLDRIKNANPEMQVVDTR